MWQLVVSHLHFGSCETASVAPSVLHSVDQTTRFFNCLFFMSFNYCSSAVSSLQVKNTHAEEVNIEVSEQVPLSTDDRIKVRL